MGFLSRALAYASLKKACQRLWHLRDVLVCRDARVPRRVRVLAALGRTVCVESLDSPGPSACTQYRR
jgi:hypothetical protein